MVQWTISSGERRELGRAAAFLAVLILSACAAPMRQGEAQNYAAAGLRKFCRNKPCGAFHLVSAQKLKDRWLVDFESPARKYAVLVDNGGDTEVSVWDKNPAR